MAGYRSRSSLHAELGAATAERKQTVAPIKAEENRGKGVEERGIGDDTKSQGVGCISPSGVAQKYGYIPKMIFRRFNGHVRGYKRTKIYVQHY
jgi:hypothetical protein